MPHNGPADHLRSSPAAAGRGTESLRQIPRAALSASERARGLRGGGRSSLVNRPVRFRGLLYGVPSRTNLRTRRSKDHSRSTDGDRTRQILDPCPLDLRIAVRESLVPKACPAQVPDRTTNRQAALGSAALPRQSIRLRPPLRLGGRQRSAASGRQTAQKSAQRLASAEQLKGPRSARQPSPFRRRRHTRGRSKSGLRSCDGQSASWHAV